MRLDFNHFSQYPPVLTSVSKGRKSSSACSSRVNIRGGARATPAPCTAASTIKRDEPKTGPFTGQGSSPAALNQPVHSSTRYEQSPVSLPRSHLPATALALSGTQST